MPVGEILRGDAALEEYLGLPRGALAKRRLQNRPVPPGIRAAAPGQEPVLCTGRCHGLAAGAPGARSF